MTGSEDKSQNERVQGVVVEPGEVPDAFGSEFSSIGAPVQSALNGLKLALCLTGAAVALIAYFFSPLVAGKVLVSAIFLTIALICLTIVFKRKWLLANLVELEEIGYLLQEEAILNMMQARHGLAMVQAKLAAASQPNDNSLNSELLRNVGPLITMLMKKETSKMSWAMFGFKIAKSAFAAIKQRR